MKKLQNILSDLMQKLKDWIQDVDKENEDWNEKIPKEYFVLMSWWQRSLIMLQVERYGKVTQLDVMMIK